MESWKKIEGFDGYEISNMGNIRSSKSGEWILLKPHKDKDGYLNINLWKKQRGYTRKIHRLVAEAFIPNLENKRTVNHKNGIKTDNRMENLEWATDKENVVHAWEKGLAKMTEFRYTHLKELNTRVRTEADIAAAMKNLQKAHEKCKIKRKWYHIEHGTIESSASELRDLFPAQKLIISKLSMVANNLRKHHKGWMKG